MKPAPFDYSRPESLPAALEALVGEDVKVLAGGQSLVPMLNLRLATATRIVDIRRVEELRRVEERPDAILYGSLTPHAAFEDRLVPDGSNGLMPQIGANIAFRSVRNRGTIGGALALADPAADWLTTVVALEAKLHLRDRSDARVVAAGDFVLGPYFTALEEGEILTAVEVPRRPTGEKWGVCKLRIKVGDYAQSLAIALVDRGRRRARVVLGAVDGAPLVLSGTAEASLAGMAADRLLTIAREEIEASGREFTPARLTMHTNAVLRALGDASL